MNAVRQARAFVRQVADLKFDHAFNPYADRCPLNDLADAAEIRCHNLQKVLEAALEQDVRSIWVARDLGYRGGRRTGLALTDEPHLHAHANLFGISGLRKSTSGHMVAERTATTIWQMLLRIGRPIFLWNAFPLHSHLPGEPMSNRCHSRAERLACRHILDRVVELIRPELVLAVGRDAQIALAELGMHAARARHPSYGGQAEFVRDVSILYGIDHVSDQQEFVL